jgi:hypothetical protein
MMKQMIPQVMTLSGFDPIVQEWFTEHLRSPTQSQALGWREVAAR